MVRICKRKSVASLYNFDLKKFIFLVLVIFGLGVIVVSVYYIQNFRSIRKSKAGSGSPIRSENNPCSDVGRVVCAEDGSQQILRCDGKKWQVVSNCMSNTGLNRICVNYLGGARCSSKDVVIKTGCNSKDLNLPPAWYGQGEKVCGNSAPVVYTCSYIKIDGVDTPTWVGGIDESCCPEGTRANDDKTSCVRTANVSGSVSKTSSPVPTVVSGWGNCGSCSNCNNNPPGSGEHPPSECVRTPEGGCTWDPGKCRKNEGVSCAWDTGQFGYPHCKLGEGNSCHPVCQSAGGCYQQCAPGLVRNSQNTCVCPSFCTVSKRDDKIKLKVGEKYVFKPSLIVQSGRLIKVRFRSSKPSVVSVSTVEDSKSPYETTVLARGVGTAKVTAFVDMDPSANGCQGNISVEVVE